MKNKKCTKCGNFYPATEEFFFKHEKCKDGLESQCKKCVRKRRRSRYQNIIYEIYCIPTNTYYIGQTVKTLTERISQHFSDAKRGRSQPLYEDIRKYDKEMFTYRILETIEDKDKLDNLERFYIDKYLNEGKQLYNKEIGGRKGCKLIESNKIGKNNPMYGKKGKDSPRSKTVYIINNNKLYIFDSAVEAKEECHFEVKYYARGEHNHYYKKKDLYVYYEDNLPESWKGEEYIRFDKGGIDDTNVE